MPKPAGAMRVLHIAEVIRGGIATALDELIPYQIEALGRDNVRVIVPSDQPSDLARVDPNVIEAVATGSRGPRALAVLLRRLRRTARDFSPDIIHAHSSLAGAVARLGRMTGSPPAPVIYSPQCWAFMMDVSRWRRTTYAFAERAMAPLTAAIIMVSNEEYRQARARGIPAAKLRVIYNGISDAPPVVPATLDGNHVNLLFLGRFDRQKGFDILIEAANRTRNLPLTIYAAGDFLHDTATLELPPNVVHLGWVDRETVRRYLDAVDAVVIPSRWEGLPFTAIEGLRHAKPLLASDAGGLRDLVERGDGVLPLLPNTADTLTAMLESLDKGTLTRMAPLARAVYENHYTAARMNLDHLALYRDVLDARSESIDYR